MLLIHCGWSVRVSGTKGGPSSVLIPDIVAPSKPSSDFSLITSEIRDLAHIHNGRELDRRRESRLDVCFPVYLWKPSLSNHDRIIWSRFLNHWYFWGFKCPVITNVSTFDDEVCYQYFTLKLSDMRSKYSVLCTALGYFSFSPTPTSNWMLGYIVLICSCFCLYTVFHIACSVHVWVYISCHFRKTQTLTILGCWPCDIGWHTRAMGPYVIFSRMYSQKILQSALFCDTSSLIPQLQHYVLCILVLLLLIFPFSPSFLSINCYRCGGNTVLTTS